MFSSRESRHILVSGIPDHWSDQKISKFFDNKPIKLERTSPVTCVVSFSDIWTAKQFINDTSKKSPDLSVTYWEPTMSKSKTSTSSSNGAGSAWNKSRHPSGDSTTTEHLTNISPISSSGRRYSFDDIISPTSVSMATSRRNESATFHTVRIDKLPSTLLISENEQIQLIKSVAKDHAVSIEVSIDACIDEADDRRATVLISISPSSTIDKFLEALNQLHIAGFPVHARVCAPPPAPPTVTTPTATSSTSKIPPPPGAPSIPVIVNGVVTEPPAHHQTYHHQSTIPDLSSIKLEHPKASRTLHVKNLERKPLVENLKARFGHVATIIDIEVKNPDSPAPYAFIQFPDIISVVNTIHHYYSSSSEEFGANKTQKFKYRLYWGTTKISQKLWLGEIPKNYTKDAVLTRFKLTQKPTEIIFDPHRHEAIAIFQNRDVASAVKVDIKEKNITFPTPGNEDPLIHVDFCSDKLQEYFTDRLQIREQITQPPPTIPYPFHGYLKEQVQASQKQRSQSQLLIDTSQPPPSLLAPPPNPPPDLSRLTALPNLSQPPPALPEGFGNQVPDSEETPGTGDEDMPSYRRHHRSPSRERDRYRRRSRDHEHRSRDRSSHRRRSRSPGRRRHSSDSGATSHYSDFSDTDSKKRHHHRGSRRDTHETSSSYRRSSIDPPPAAPHLEGFTAISDESTTTIHQGETPQKPRHDFRHPPPPPQPPRAAPQQPSQVEKRISTGSKDPPPEVLAAVQYQRKKNMELGHVKEDELTEKYICKSNSRPFRDASRDPRSHPYIPDVTRLTLPFIIDFDRRYNGRKPSNFTLAPLNLTDRPRLSSSSSTHTSEQSRIAEKLKKFKPDEKNPLKITIPPVSNVKETAQQALSAMSLNTPTTASPSSIRRPSGFGSGPTPSPIARQNSLSIPPGHHHGAQIPSPLSANSGSAVSTPKTSAAISPHVPVYSQSSQMASLLLGAKMAPPQPPKLGSLNNPRSQSMSKVSTTSISTGPTGKFVTTPQTPDKPGTGVPRPRLATTSGATPLQKEAALGAKAMLKKLPEKKPSLPMTPVTPGSAKIRELSTFGAFKQDKIRRDSSTSSTTPIKKPSTSSKFDRSSSFGLSSDREDLAKDRKRKKKKEPTPPPPQDDYVAKLLAASNRDKTKDKDKEARKAARKARREKEAREAAAAEEERLRKAAKKEKKEKKKKKHSRGSDHEGDSDDSEGSVAAAGIKSLKRDYDNLISQGLDAEVVLGSSLYDRIKRRTSHTKEDENAQRKKDALEKLAEIAKKKKQQRVMLDSEDAETTMDVDSEGMASTASQDSFKKKKIDEIEKQRREDRKKEKELQAKEKEKEREAEKVKAKEERRKSKDTGETKEERRARKEKERAEKLKKLSLPISSDNDTEPKPGSSKPAFKFEDSEKDTDGEISSTPTATTSRRGSLKDQQKNILKRFTVKKRYSSESEDDDEPETKQNFDMDDVFGGGSSSEEGEKKSSKVTPKVEKSVAEKPILTEKELEKQRKRERKEQKRAAKAAAEEAEAKTKKRSETEEATKRDPTKKLADDEARAKEAKEAKKKAEAYEASKKKPEDSKKKHEVEDAAKRDAAKKAAAEEARKAVTDEAHRKSQLEATKKVHGDDTRKFSDIAAKKSAADAIKKDESSRKSEHKKSSTPIVPSEGKHKHREHSAKPTTQVEVTKPPTVATSEDRSKADEEERLRRKKERKEKRQQEREAAATTVKDVPGAATVISPPTAPVEKKKKHNDEHRHEKERDKDKDKPKEKEKDRHKEPKPLIPSSSSHHHRPKPPSEMSKEETKRSSSQPKIPKERHPERSEKLDVAEKEKLREERKKAKELKRAATATETLEAKKVEPESSRKRKTVDESPDQAAERKSKKHKRHESAEKSEKKLKVPETTMKSVSPLPARKSGHVEPVTPVTSKMQPITPVPTPGSSKMIPISPAITPVADTSSPKPVAVSEVPATPKRRPPLPPRLQSPLNISLSFASPLGSPNVEQQFFATPPPSPKKKEEVKGMTKALEKKAVEIKTTPASIVLDTPSTDTTTITKKVIRPPPPLPSRMSHTIDELVLKGLEEKEAESLGSKSPLETLPPRKLSRTVTIDDIVPPLSPSTSEMGSVSSSDSEAERLIMAKLSEVTEPPILEAQTKSPRASTLAFQGPTLLRTSPPVLPRAIPPTPPVSTARPTIVAPSPLPQSHEKSLPPVREESPIPVPQALEVAAASPLRALSESGSSTADEAALLQLMQRDTQESQDAAKALQEQMDEEDAFEDYAYGPQRIAAKKRESDASVDTLRHQLHLDRRLSSDGSTLSAASKSTPGKALISPRFSIDSLSQAAPTSEVPFNIYSRSLMMPQTAPILIPQRPPILPPTMPMMRPPSSVPLRPPQGFFSQTPGFPPRIPPLQTLSQIPMTSASFQSLPPNLQAAIASMGIQRSPFQSPIASTPPMVPFPPRLLRPSESVTCAAADMPGPSRVLPRKPLAGVSLEEWAVDDPSRMAVEALVESLGPGNRKPGGEKSRPSKRKRPKKKPNLENIQIRDRALSIDIPSEVSWPFMLPPGGIPPFPASEMFRTTYNPLNRFPFFASRPPGANNDEVNPIQTFPTLSGIRSKFNSIPREIEDARVRSLLLRYPVVWEGNLKYRDTYNKCQFHTLFSFKHDFRIGLQYELTQVENMEPTLEINYKSVIGSPETNMTLLRGIFETTILSPKMPFSLVIGFSAFKPAAKKKKTKRRHRRCVRKNPFMKELRDEFYVTETKEFVSGIVTQHQTTGLHLLFPCKGTEVILETYAPEMLKLVQHLKCGYVLGILTFDYCNYDRFNHEKIISEQRRCLELCKKGEDFEYEMPDTQELRQARLKAPTEKEPGEITLTDVMLDLIKDLENLPDSTES